LLSSGWFLAGVLTVAVSGEALDLAAGLLLLMMVVGTGVGLTVSWSGDRRH
jgi:hypothetical protein